MPLAAPGVVRFYDLAPAPADFLELVTAGLTRRSRQIPPRLFYDSREQELAAPFRELPDYALARAEMRVMLEHMGEMTEFLGPDAILIEVGGGAPHASRVLAAAIRPLLYVVLDDEAARIRQMSQELHAALPWLNISGVCADYRQPLHLPEWSGVAYRRKLAYLSGSMIGGFSSGEAFDFLRLARQMLGDDGAMLIGFDLKIDARVLHAAYNDAQAAARNLNLLTRINFDLNADFDLNGYAHHALYDVAKGRVELQIKSLRAQTVSISGQLFDFAAAEAIHTANASKYALEEIPALAKQVGFNAERVWLDAERQFSIHGFSASRN
jgi:dimethylhistidine N-methyltransferase